MAIPIISQVISAIAAVLHRDTINPTDPATQDAFVQSAEAFFDKISDTTVDELNQLKTEINNTVEAINITSQEINEAATIAIASGQYKGEWVAGYQTVGYQLGDGVTFSDGYNYVSKINNNLTTPITLTNTAQWNFIEAVNPNNYYLKTETYTKTEIDNLHDINNKTNKTTPVDTDNLLIQENGGLFKKLSWSNLKTTLKTYFDALYLNLFAINSGVIDANTLSSGRRYVSSTSSNIPIASVGFIDCIALEGSNVMQVFTTVSASEGATGIQYIRMGNATTNVWTGWTKKYSQRNILGTVSQSAGIPTGAIIETGSNANGEWTKYADGTIDGTTIFTADLTANTASGNLFIVVGSLTVPTTLASISDVQLVSQRVSGGVTMASLQSGGFTTSAINLYLIGSTTGTVGKVKARFKGRWY